MNFGELKSEVFTLVIDTPQAVQTLVPRFINRALRRIQGKHNFKVMETSITTTTVASQRNLVATRPSDWKEARNFPFYTTEMGRIVRLYWAGAGEGLASYGANAAFDYGAPRLLAENVAGTFQVFPYPDGLSDYTDGEYRISIPYWAYLPPLTNDEDTNWFTENAEEWLIYRATAFAFYANEDEARGKHWDAMAQREWNDILLIDKRRRLAMTDTLVPHIGALPPHTQE